VIAKGYILRDLAADGKDDIVVLDEEPTEIIRRDIFAWQGGRMPVQIGARTHNFSNPTGLLSDCHRRIEMFLRSLQSVALVIDRPLSEESRASLESALRYFREAAPKHTADEEESLFPRLRQMDRPGVKDAIEQLESLEHEHLEAASLHAEVDELGQQCLLDGSMESDRVDAFRNTIARLTSIYAQHIAIEDDVIFPLATRLLNPTDKAAIGTEMAARRTVKSMD
jgi:hemerythrin-like domain-containing protein